MSFKNFFCRSDRYYLRAFRNRERGRVEAERFFLTVRSYATGAPARLLSAYSRFRLPSFPALKSDNSDRDRDRDRDRVNICGVGYRRLYTDNHGFYYRSRLGRVRVSRDGRGVYFPVDSLTVRSVRIGNRRVSGVGNRVIHYSDDRGAFYFSKKSGIVRVIESDNGIYSVVSALRSVRPVPDYTGAFWW